MNNRQQEHKPQRLYLALEGMLQGVGFRPFVYRLATELKLNGWVKNSNSGAEIEVEGLPFQLNLFLNRLECDRPTQSSYNKLEPHWLNPLGYQGFEIQTSSQDQGLKSAWVLPDLSTCPACLQEIFDPQNRRFRYPFTNCTCCGPRYSILKALPYDRPNTTLKDFSMCAACQLEYDTPSDRRFHTQPNACPDCGPQVELWNPDGQTLETDSNATLIQQVAARILRGEIIALKGIGGFHLMVDARNHQAIQRLRDRKHRPTKPLALMYPNLEVLGQDCHLSAVETQLLQSAAAPIVLLKPKLNPHSAIAISAIAPNQNSLGVMLPYSPLHHLLLAELNCPLVATSGNPSQQPVCIDNQDAIRTLGQIADVFVMHNRPIVRPVDDSVVQIIQGQGMVIRRSRGYAPSPIAVEPSMMPLRPILAMGGHLKNTIALAMNGKILVSQHLGDLGNAQTFERFHQNISQLLELFEFTPQAIACDQHPDYTSTQVAHALSQKLNVPLVPVQHHYAHILAGMVDNSLAPPVLGVAWDGTGYGLDNTIWGGEFLAISNPYGFVRMAHLKTFSLPGGDLVAKEPYRAALGLLYGALGEQGFEVEIPGLDHLDDRKLQSLQAMLQQNVNAPTTSSIGRLFDGIASLLGLCQISTFEGEAAMGLEAAIAGYQTTERYPFDLIPDASGALNLDWTPMLIAVLSERDHLSVDVIAAKFHNTLIEALVAIAHEVGYSQVLLTGGCFQNQYLLEGAIRRLREDGFLPYWHQTIPPNDGGISVGQVIGGAWRLEQTRGGLSCV